MTVDLSMKFELLDCDREEWLGFKLILILDRLWGQILQNFIWPFLTKSLKLRQDLSHLDLNH